MFSGARFFATGQLTFQPTLKHSVSVMFRGCIGPNGVRRFVRCHGQIKAVKYIEILQDNVH